MWTFANLNLAIVYVRTRREADFAALLDRISPERLPSQSHSLQAAAYYIQGLQEFFSAKYNDAKYVLHFKEKKISSKFVNFNLTNFFLANFFSGGTLEKL